MQQDRRLRHPIFVQQMTNKIRRTERATVRLHPEVFARLRRRTSRLRLSVSELLRRL